MAEFPDFLKYCNLCCSIHFDSHSNPNTARVFDILDTFNTEQAVSEQTHQQGHILDWVPYWKEEHMLCFCVVKHCISSDHLSVFCHLDVTHPPQQHIFQTVRNTRTIDRQVLKADVATLITAFNFPTANQLNDQLHTFLDRHAPATQCKVSWWWPSPWYSAVTLQLHTLKQDKRRAERLWLCSRLTIHKQIFSAVKHKITRLVDSAKTAFYSSKIILSTTCEKLFFFEKVSIIQHNIDSCVTLPPLVWLSSFSGE